MKENRNLPKLQISSENEMKIKGELVLALDRTGLKNFEDNIIDKVFYDIMTKFPKLEIKLICEIINDGGFGEYGRTYNFSTQEIGLWIKKRLQKQENEIYNPSDNIPSG